jgi:hypothetical protein
VPTSRHRQRRLSATWNVPLVVLRFIDLTYRVAGSGSNRAMSVAARASPTGARYCTRCVAMAARVLMRKVRCTGPKSCRGPATHSSMPRTSDSASPRTASPSTSACQQKTCQAFSKANDPVTTLPLESPTRGGTVPPGLG